MGIRARGVTSDAATAQEQFTAPLNPVAFCCDTAMGRADTQKDIFSQTVFPAFILHTSEAALKS